jgi:tRNA-Thr(GGU) m(6)t(6)A37 methyltransferase TsaA
MAGASHEKELYQIRPIGQVQSPLLDLVTAPAQGDENAPDAWLVLDLELLPAMRSLALGDRLIVLTWLDRADREVLEVHPRSDPTRPLQGVFSTRSPDRPNPIGVHEVEVIQMHEARIQVRGLEAIDGTPIVDIKPVLGPIGKR